MGTLPRARTAPLGRGWQSRKAEGAGPSTTHKAGLAAPHREKRPSEGTGLGISESP